MVIKSFTWQVPMQMHPLLCRTAKGYVQQQQYKREEKEEKEKFLQSKRKTMFPVNTHYWFPLVREFLSTHTGSSSWITRLLLKLSRPPSILIYYLGLSSWSSPGAPSGFSVWIFIVFSVPEALGTMILDSFFFVPWSESWRLLLWPWCFFSQAQNRSWLWPPCCSFEMPLKCFQDFQI